jgi:hypothetical protein
LWLVRLLLQGRNRSAWLGSHRVAAYQFAALQQVIDPRHAVCIAKFAADDDVAHEERPVRSIDFAAK